MSTTDERREFVVRMTRLAWDGYVQYAWPHDMLRPLTKDGHQEVFGPNSGQTIVNAMSTLKVMGLEEEFRTAREWVANELQWHFSALIRPVNVFQVVSEYIGGLLSCYALTSGKDSMFLARARQIAALLRPAYRTMTGLPFEMIIPRLGVASGVTPYMTYLGTGLLEYPYLTYLTGDREFQRRVDRIRGFIEKRTAEKTTTKGGLLCRERIHSQTGAWCSSSTSLFGASRDYIAGLLKRYIQSGRQDSAAISQFRRLMDAAEEGGLFAVSRGGLVYCRNFDHESRQYGDFMNNTGCYLSAVLALDAVHQPKPAGLLFKEAFLQGGSEYGGPRSKEVHRAYRPLIRARELAETFHEAGRRSPNGLMPRNYYFDRVDDATNSRHSSAQYFQR